MKKQAQRVSSFVLVLIIVFSCFGVSLTAEATQDKSGNFSRNYSLGNDLRQNLVNVATAQIGKTKSDLGYTEAWCADFVTDCARLTGMSDSIIPYNYSARGGCKYLYPYMKNQCGAQPVSDRQKGDIVFYYCSECGTYVHVGIVLDGSNSIEGNYGGKVTKVGNSYTDSSGHTLKSGTIQRHYLRPNYSDVPNNFPGEEDTSYNVPAWVTANQQSNTYDGNGYMESGHYIDAGDNCYIEKVFKNGFCILTYPTSSGERRAYAKADIFNIPKKSTQVSGLDLGTNFYAAILHAATSNALTNESDNVTFRCNKAKKTQIWYFERRSDGAYKISNCHEANKVLGIADNASNPQANVKVCSSNDSEAQRWFITGSEGQFVFKSQNGDVVLDLQGGNYSEGVNAQVDTPNYTDAQKFSIVKKDKAIIDLGDPLDLGSDFYASILHASTGNAVTASSDNVAFYADKQKTHQKWHFQREANGSYRITNCCYDKVLSVTNGFVLSGANVQIDNKYYKPFQRWFILGTAGKYYLLSEGGDCVLDLQGGVFYDGVNAEVCNLNSSQAQQFSIVKRNKSIIDLGNPVDIGTNFYARITITSDKKMLTRDKNDNVCFRSDTGEQSQIWKFDRDSDGAYTITNLDNGKVLELYQGIAASQTNVSVYKNNNNLWQKWFIYGSQGSYYLKPRNGDFMLDLQGGKYSEGVNAQIYNFNGTPAQKFTITKINRTATYTISYNMNGGSGTISNQTKTNDIALKLSTTKPTRQGYTFSGWSTSSNATTAQYQPGGSYTANSAATLYAVWDPGHIMSESEAAGRTIPDGDYYIVNEINPDYFLDIPGDNFDTTNGKNVCMLVWSSHMPKQEGYDCFHVQYLNNGFYKLTQLNTKMCLDHSGNSTNKGANVHMWEDNGNNSQQWSIEKTNHGYRLRARCSSYYLDVHNAKHESNTNVKCWESNNSQAQSFSFIPRNTAKAPIEDGDYIIRTKVNGSSWLSVNGTADQYTSGSNVQISNGASENVFNFMHMGDGWYRISEKTSGLVLEVADPTADFLKTKNIQLGNDTGEKKQLWTISANSDGSYFIINKASGYCIDLSNSNVDSGTTVFQYIYNGNTNQRWTLEKTIVYEYKLSGWTWNGTSSATANFTCTNDSSKNKTVNATITSKTTAATCETAGKTVYTATVSFEGKTYTNSKQAAIPATGHSYKLTSWNWNGFNSATAKFTCEKDNSHTQTVNAVITSKTTAATSETAGKIVYTATAVFEGKTYTDSQTYFEYNQLSDGTVAITKYYGTDSNVTVPSTIGGKTVTKFGKQAFANCPTLENITLPASLKSAGYDTFIGCANLKNIYVPSDSVKYVSIDGVLYSKNKATLVCCPGAKTSITMPNTLKTVGGFSLYGCEKLISVKIPDSVTNIMNHAFYNCTSLQNITIPNSVTSIGNDAFYNCPSLSIYGCANSYAQTYANENNIPFKPVTETVAVTSVAISSSTLNLDKGKTAALTATVSPSNATDKKITWTSSNTSVAKVSSSGVVTGVSAGTATIKATSTNGISAKCTVTVKDNTTATIANTSTLPTSITLGSSITMKGSATGGTAPYKYTYKYKKASADTWTALATNTTETSKSFKPGAATTYDIKSPALPQHTISKLS